VIYECVAKRFCITVLRITIELPIPFTIAKIDVAVLVNIAKFLFEEGGDVVYYTTQILVAICLGCL